MKQTRRENQSTIIYGRNAQVVLLNEWALQLILVEARTSGSYNLSWQKAAVPLPQVKTVTEISVGDDHGVCYVTPRVITAVHNWINTRLSLVDTRALA